MQTLQDILNSLTKQSIKELVVRDSFPKTQHKQYSLSLSLFPMVSNKRVTALLLIMLAILANSDLSKDREECADKLVTLASCLPYVGGDANTPTIDCCTSLKLVLDKTKKCICILIKDRNDPKLGFTLNATLAVHLPTACHIPSNISQCVGKYISHHVNLVCYIIDHFFDLVFSQIFCICRQNLLKLRCLKDLEILPKQTVPQQVLLLRRDQVQRKRVVVVWERGGWWQRWFVLFYHLFSYLTSSSQHEP